MVLPAGARLALLAVVSLPLALSIRDTFDVDKVLDASESQEQEGRGAVDPKDLKRNEMVLAKETFKLKSGNQVEAGDIGKVQMVQSDVILVEFRVAKVTQVDKPDFGKLEKLPDPPQAGASKVKSRKPLAASATEDNHEDSSSFRGRKESVLMTALEQQERAAKARRKKEEEDSYKGWVQRDRSDQVHQKTYYNPVTEKESDTWPPEDEDGELPRAPPKRKRHQPEAPPTRSDSEDKEEDSEDPEEEVEVPEEIYANVKSLPEKIAGKQHAKRWVMADEAFGTRNGEVLKGEPGKILEVGVDAVTGAVEFARIRFEIAGKLKLSKSKGNLDKLSLVTEDSIKEYLAEKKKAKSARQAAEHAESQQKAFERLQRLKPTLPPFWYPFYDPEDGKTIKYKDMRKGQVMATSPPSQAAATKEEQACHHPKLDGQWQSSEKAITQLINITGDHVQAVVTGGLYHGLLVTGDCSHIAVSFTFVDFVGSFNNNQLSWGREHTWTRVSSRAPPPQHPPPPPPGSEARPSVKAPREVEKDGGERIYYVLKPDKVIQESHLYFANAPKNTKKLYVDFVGKFCKGDTVLISQDDGKSHTSRIQGVVTSTFPNHLLLERATPYEFKVGASIELIEQAKK